MLAFFEEIEYNVYYGFLCLIYAKKGGCQMRRFIALLLAVAIMASVFVMPAAAVDSEDPLAVKNFKEFGAVPEDIIEETEPAVSTEPSVQVETVPAETQPEETQPPKKIPQETQPVQEIPEETTENTEETQWPYGHNGVPLYFQNDYPTTIYGMGTVETSGCSAAALAMVATYMTGHEYRPDEIARYFGGAAENNIARLEKGSTTMRLAYKKAKDWHETLEAVRDGKIAIVMVDNRSVFTQSQHFIIMTGINEEGKVLVNDSWKPNYEEWDSKDGLQNGFDPSAILAGYSGAWIYNKEAMPKDPYIYYEPAPVRGEPRYDLELTWQQMQLIAKVVWVEARGESKEGQQAVAEVVLNRLTSDKFPNNLHDVIYGEGQFRSAKFLDTATPYQLQYEAVENALLGPYVLPKDVYYFATKAMTSKVWGKIGGHVFSYSDN